MIDAAGGRRRGDDPGDPDDAMAAGTVVEVKGVVVTAIDSYGNRTGDLWVQEVVAARSRA